MFSFDSHRFEIEIRFFYSIKNQVIFSFLRLRKSRFQLHNFDSNVMYINDSFSYYSLHVRNSYPRVPIICQQTDPALSVTCQSDHTAHHRQFRHLGVSPEVLKIAQAPPLLVWRQCPACVPLFSPQCKRRAALLWHRLAQNAGAPLAGGSFRVPRE